MSPETVCPFCGEAYTEPNHIFRCNGRQGEVEALGMEAADLAQIVDADENDPRDGTIAERAERFHVRNPGVYRFAVSVTRFAKRRGLQHYGIGAVWEVMRFKYLETHGDIYKLNNNHRAWYARQIMAQEADLVGFFSIRECPNDADYRTRVAS